MSKHAVHFSSESKDWESPADVFDICSALHGPFDLDVCATARNAKCGRYFAPADNGLVQPWQAVNAWMNPPYGREIALWVAKAVQEVECGNAGAVTALLPARTDSAWWQDHVMRRNNSVFFVRGRLRFAGAASSAPFPSAIAVFYRRHPVVDSGPWVRCLDIRYLVSAMDEANPEGWRQEVRAIKSRPLNKETRSCGSVLAGGFSK